jgi:hypothetical protein
MMPDVLVLNNIQFILCKHAISVLGSNVVLVSLEAKSGIDNSCAVQELSILVSCLTLISTKLQPFS